MKVAFKKDDNVCLRDVDEPQVGAGQIRLKVDACGICGTDLHSDPGQKGVESMFGHEIAGTILEVGPGVEYLKPGQRVVLDSSTPCGRCDACRNARQELCTQLESFFCIGSFGFAEQMIAPAISAIVCEDLTPEIASLQEPLGVAIDLVRLAEIRPGDNVVIMGQGPIGLMAVSLVRQAGASKVFVSDFASRVGRKKVAEAFGVDAYLDPVSSPLDEHDFGCQIDKVLVTSPPKTLNTAFTIARKGAIVSFIGIAHGDGAFCNFDVNAFHFKKLQLRASFASPALYGPAALDLLRSGVVDGQAIVSHTYPLDEISQAMETARECPDAVKVVVTM